MALAFGAAGTVLAPTSNNPNSIAPAYPTTAPTASRRYLTVAVIGIKPDTGSISTPSGWSLLGTVAGGAGSNGNDTGPTELSIFTRNDRTTAPNSSTQTFSFSGVSVGWAQMLRWECALTEDFDVAMTSGVDTSTGTAYSVTTSSVAAGFIQLNDHLLVSTVFPTDTLPTWGTPTLVANGAGSGSITLGTVTQRGAPATSGGNDAGGRIVTMVPTSVGTINAGTLTYAATLSGTTTNAAGPTGLVRIRAIIPPPSAPTGLTATGVSTTQINLSWNTVSGATDYALERSANGSTGWTRINGAAPQTGTSYNDTGLTISTSYYYRVSVTTSTGTSSPSSTVLGRTYIVPPYVEDFEAYTFLQEGVWTPDWALSATPDATVLDSFGVGDTNGEAVLGTDGTTGAAQALLKSVPQTGQGMLIVFTHAIPASTIKVSLRASGGWSGINPANGYVATVGTSDGNTIERVVSGSATTLSPTGETWSAPTYLTEWKFRMEVVGTTIRTRSWASSTSEPSTWRTVTDSNITSGVLGISMASSGGVCDIEEIQFYAIADEGPPPFAAFGIPL